ncbi:hypothetical protein SLA2020_173020 [Shorea laevis]
MGDSRNGHIQPAFPVCTSLVWQLLERPREMFSLCCYLCLVVILCGRLCNHCCLKCTPQDQSEGANQRTGCVLDAIPALAPW